MKRAHNFIDRTGEEYIKLQIKHLQEQLNN